jgi:hypothetical protein
MSGRGGGGGGSTHSVSVAIRLRPPAPSETSDGVLAAVGGFRYPSGVLQGSDQAAACAALTDRLLEKLRQGFSCTLLAYGQTGSGKTHTMFGPPGAMTEESLETATIGGGGSGGSSNNSNNSNNSNSNSNSAPPLWGVFPRTMLKLLSMPGLGSFHASAVEVYMDNAFDLLANRKVLAVGARQRQADNANVSGLIWSGSPLVESSGGG